jgi:hypothetical protein
MTRKAIIKLKKYDMAFPLIRKYRVPVPYRAKFLAVYVG